MRSSRQNPEILRSLNPQILSSDRLQIFQLRRVLRRCYPLFDEGIPVVAMRTLPEQLGAAVPAAHADVRVEIEDGVFGQLAVAVDERLGMPEMTEGAPDRLMDAEGVRILDERRKQELQRLLRPAARREMPRQRQARPPVLCVFFDQAPAEVRKSIGVAGPHG